MLSHDYIFWCGDFNYRINMCREDVLTCVKNNDFETLLSADQLKIEHGNKTVFEDFHEGDIDFAPTYKYDLFSEDYDSSEKCRVPAWTDRVLWRRRHLAKDPIPNWSPGTVKFYGRAELKQSDHRYIFDFTKFFLVRVTQCGHFNDFSITRILREINFGDSRISKLVILTH